VRVASINSALRGKLISNHQFPGDGPGSFHATTDQNKAVD